MGKSKKEALWLLLGELRYLKLAVFEEWNKLGCLKYGFGNPAFYKGVTDLIDKEISDELRFGDGTGQSLPIRLAHQEIKALVKKEFLELVGENERTPDRSYTSSPFPFGTPDENRKIKARNQLRAELREKVGKIEWKTK